MSDIIRKLNIYKLINIGDEHTINLFNSIDVLFLKLRVIYIDGFKYIATEYIIIFSHNLSTDIIYYNYDYFRHDIVDKYNIAYYDMRKILKQELSIRYNIDNSYSILQQTNTYFKTLTRELHNKSYNNWHYI